MAMWSEIDGVYYIAPSNSDAVSSCTWAQSIRHGATNENPIQICLENESTSWGYVIV